MKGATEYVRNMGLNTKDVMDKVVNNFDKLNKYNFENGVQGLTKMAAKAAMFRIDMGQAFSLAEQAMDPENAINLASTFQRLGVTAGNLVDPFALMNASINDPGALQDSIVNMSKQYTFFDEKTKSFKINPQGMLTLRQIAKEASLDYDQLTKAGLAASELDNRLSKISPSITFKDESDKQFLSNLSQMDGSGNYVVNISDTQTKNLSDVTQEEFDKLIEQQKKSPKTMEDIARSQLNLDQLIRADVGAIKESVTRGISQTGIVRTNLEGFRNVLNATLGSVSKAVVDNKMITTKNFDKISDSMSSAIKGMIKGGKSPEEIVSELKNTFGKSYTDSLGKAATDIGENIKKYYKTGASGFGGSEIEEIVKKLLSSTINKSDSKKEGTTTNPISAKGESTIKPSSSYILGGMPTESGESKDMGELKGMIEKQKSSNNPDLAQSVLVKNNKIETILDPTQFSALTAKIGDPTDLNKTKDISQSVLIKNPKLDTTIDSVQYSGLIAQMGKTSGTITPAETSKPIINKDNNLVTSIDPKQFAILTAKSEIPKETLISDGGKLLNKGGTITPDKTSKSIFKKEDNLMVSVDPRSFADLNEKEEKLKKENNLVQINSPKRLAFNQEIPSQLIKDKVIKPIETKPFSESLALNQKNPIQPIETEVTKIKKPDVFETGLNKNKDIAMNTSLISELLLTNLNKDVSKLKIDYPKPNKETFSKPIDFDKREKITQSLANIKLPEVKIDYSKLTTEKFGKTDYLDKFTQSLANIKLPEVKIDYSKLTTEKIGKTDYLDKFNEINQKLLSKNTTSEINLGNLKDLSKIGPLNVPKNKSEITSTITDELKSSLSKIEIPKIEFNSSKFGPEKIDYSKYSVNSELPKNIKSESSYVSNKASVEKIDQFNSLKKLERTNQSLTSKVDHEINFGTLMVKFDMPPGISKQEFQDTIDSTDLKQKMFGYVESELVKKGAIKKTGMV